ncbi:MAG: 50S ribosomal protein L3 [Pirellulales bacterium]
MTQVFDESGKSIPVTVIQAGPCHVLQLKTVESDGYDAVQLGYADKPRRLAIRSERGHVANLSSKRSKKLAANGVEPNAKPNCEPQRFIRELRGPVEGYEVGQEVGANVLSDVKSVDIIGTSKGRGYAGVMKRHNFHGQRATHGVKKVHRHTGGTGCSANPSRTFKGMKMSGHYGNAKVTQRNIKIFKIDEENGLILVQGAVPGANGGYVVVRETNTV